MMMDDSFTGWDDGRAIAAVADLTTLPPSTPPLPSLPATTTTTITAMATTSSLMDDPAYVLGSMAMIWLLTILALASMPSSLVHLGERPRGRNLWQWTFRRSSGTTTTSSSSPWYGYDVIQGALAPGLRLQCHGVAMLFLWSFLYLVGVGCMEDDDHLPYSIKYKSNNEYLYYYYNIMENVPRGVWRTGIYASLVYTFGCLLSSCLMDGVSMPGGPRTYKMARQPHWEDVWTLADTTLTATPTKCLVADQSYDHTHATFEPSILSLTGEAAGRQIWVPDHPTPVPSPTKKIEHVMSQLLRAVSGGNGGGGSTDTPSPQQQQAIIEELARGGRSEFGFNPSINPNSCDMLFRKQQIEAWLLANNNHGNNKKKLPDLKAPPPTKVQDATKKAAFFYSMLQCEDGHWAADYGGPHFLMPGLVTAWYIMGQPEAMLSKTYHVPLLIKYILCHQQSDGGWGTHIESPSTMFGSTLMYVALRLLGVEADHPAAVKGQAFLQAQGGALYTSSWSKFYLCLLGLMDWKGHNSVPPEMWLLPNWCPFHPGRMWCHARMVYLPMGYLYGHRFVYPQAETDPLIAALRRELYASSSSSSPTPSSSYESIDWMPTRHWVAEMDNYSPIPWMMKVLQNGLARYENWSIFQPFKSYVRAKGLAFSMEYIRAEDLQTNYIDIGPVNKVLNMISHFHASGGNLQDPTVVNHMMRVADYLWVAEDGMKMQGYNGSQCWDTSFCTQAMYEAGLLDEFADTSKKVWSYLERTQILSTEVSQASPALQYESNEYRQKFYRHISQGGWPFSTSAHGWPISDCTGEGLKATLCLLKSECVQQGLKDGSLRPISDERLYQAVNVLLTYQNEDGGWATYENNRGWGWYEQLNPSEVFGDIMIDYSYVECSMASLTALVDFQERYPDHRTRDIEHAIDKGRDFLKCIQRDDGSWYGSWACCFTYGIWFGVEGLVKCGEALDSPCILDACQFLLKHQRPNGGWGEDFTSCYDKDYAKEGMKAYGDDGSGIVNTAWALMALSMAECKDVDAVRRGVKYLMKRQLPSGDWPQEGISGVFNRSVGITYTAYRNVFPLWAMGRCYAVYGDELEKEA